MRIDCIYEDDSNTVVSTYQEGGPHWLGGTVIDVLNEHLTGQRKLKRIVIHPDSTEPGHPRDTDYRS